MRPRPLYGLGTTCPSLGWLLSLTLLACLTACGSDADPAGTVSGSSSDAPTPSASTSDISGDEAFTERSDVGPALPDRLLTAAEMRELVNPWIGSGGIGFGYASLTPAAQWPNGLVKVGPETTRAGSHMPQEHFSGYNDNDPDVRGFGHLRMVGTGAPDLGILQFLPLRSPPDRAGQTWTAMDKDSEEAAPGWYRVRLPNEAVTVELVAGHDQAIHRYTPEGQEPFVLFVDPLSSVTDRESERSSLSLDGDGLLRGHLFFQGGFTGRRRGFDVWFVAHFDAPPAALQQRSEEGAWTEAESIDTARGVLVWDSTPEEVHMRLALSLVSEEHAEERLNAIRAATAESLRAEAEEAWDAIFERYRFQGRHRGDAIKLSTAIYNLYRMPTLLGPVGTPWRGFDGEVHTADFPYLTDLSLWDSFRTLHPVLELAHPELARATVQSLMAMYAQSGGVPRWPAFLNDTGSMIGSPAAMVFAGAILKGLVDDLDPAELLMALYDTDYGDHEDPRLGRPDLDVLLELGYYPADVNESVSKTLEYAWSDDAMARIARHIGQEALVPLAIEGRDRWRFHFDPQTRFFQPRARDGSWERVRNTAAVFMRTGPFCEGSAWHWRFYVFQDAEALADLLGPAEMGEALETLFERSAIASDRSLNHALPDPYYWQGNEPPLSSPWMFHVTDRPERGPWWVARILDRAYGIGSDGIPGNDDGGTLSAWLVAAMFGLYPIAGTELYRIGPLHVDRVVLSGTSNGQVTLERDPRLRRDALACIVDGDGTVHRDTISHDRVRGTLRFVPLDACDDD